MSYFIHPDNHDQTYIPAAPISVRELALHLQNEFPGQIFAIIQHSGFAPRCIKLIDNIRSKIHLGMVHILPHGQTEETELLIDGQFMGLTADITHE